MTEHVCEWILGDIGTTRHVRVGWVCESPSCSEFLAVTQVGVRLNATERLSAETTLETLADIEHERWSGWMRYQFANWTDENIERWKALMDTPYSDLSEHSKESDRKEVRKTLKAIADILEDK